MLMRLRDYVKKQGRVSLTQISREFQIDEEALIPMMEFWTRKKLMTVTQGQVDCKGCRKCEPQLYYSTQ